MKRFLLSTFALSLLAFAPAAFAAAPIDPALVKEMDAATASGTHDVTAIVLCDQELSRRGLHGTAGEVKRALETHANRTQAGVLQDCKNIWVYPEPLWIVNGMIVKTSALQIRRIAEFKGVRSVRANHKHSLPKTVAAPVKDSVGPYVWSQMNMNVPAARETYGMTGAGVLVGQLDTGMFEEHVDLKGKVYAWKDFISDKPKPYDDHSHGTHTGGSILGGNGSGKWIGGAPDAKIAVAKIFSASGSADDAGILKAMQWIMDPDGNPETNDAPRVVNNSWGDDNVSFELRPAVQAWVAANMFPAFSNGNSGPSAGTVGSPAAYEESFGVGAASSNFSIAYFSSRGPAKYEGKVVVKPDITGPGASVISSMPNGKWSSMSGTSMSCPSVVGVIALLYQAKPDITIAEVREVLESTAKPAGAEGKDNVFGSGHVDAKAALAKVLGKTNASKPEIAAADRVIEALEKAPTAAVKDGARFLRDRLMMIEDPAAKAKIARLTDLLR